MARENRIGGVPLEVLEDVANNMGGEIKATKYGTRIVSKRIIIAPSRLGISETPDPLGTVTSKQRPGNLAEGLRRLDVVQRQVKTQS